MASVSTYLNVDRTAEEAFAFYKDAFGTEFDGVVRFGDTPMEGAPPISEEAAALIAALVEGGSVDDAMHDAEWGAYFGAIKDRFGIEWMLHVDRVG